MATMYAAFLHSFYLEPPGKHTYHRWVVQRFIYWSLLICQNAMYRLQILNVSSNKLTSLPILSPNDEGRSLVELYASDNQLEPALNIIAG